MANGCFQSVLLLLNPGVLVGTLGPWPSLTFIIIVRLSDDCHVCSTSDYSILLDYIRLGRQAGKQAVLLTAQWEYAKSTTSSADVIWGRREEKISCHLSLVSCVLTFCVKVVLSVWKQLCISSFPSTANLPAADRRKATFSMAESCCSFLFGRRQNREVFASGR